MWASLGPWPYSKCYKTVEVRCTSSDFHQRLLHVSTALFCTSIHTSKYLMYWHVLACIVVCIGGIFWMHTSMYQYWQVCIQYIPVCIGMYCVGIIWVSFILTDWIHTTTHATTHAKIGRKHIGMYCNPYKYIPACIGMYLVGIWYEWANNTCQYRPNTCLFFQYVPMQAPIYSPI